MTKVKSAAYTGDMEQHTQVDPYVRALVDRQITLGITADEFARRLGIHPSYWSLICAGKRGIGIKLINGGLAAFPDIPYPCVQDFPKRKEISCVSA